MFNFAQPQSMTINTFSFFKFILQTVDRRSSSHCDSGEGTIGLLIEVWLPVIYLLTLLMTCGSVEEGCLI